MVRGNCHVQLISRITVELKGLERVSLPRVGRVDLPLKPLEKNVMQGQLFQEKWDKYPEKIWEQIDHVYLEFNMKSYFLARPVWIRENSRDCFKVRSFALTLS
ncbi:hypothetical protein M9H77_30893 [Catharanthus roseus]|uniref:Uncharacterized protein n=1 Tax=Catharanthus roseus TaxID=4058 RepID=A0ACB9ZZH5_CATRO|nr:hypothetical protein M9H77_30893 [Catharanthus roseus]